MPFYPNHVVEHVRAQRREGSSIKALAKTFGICYTTIARWVYDIPSESAQFKKARARDEARKRQFRDIVWNRPILEDEAKLLAAILYWCEGAKHPSTGHLDFANSDWRLVKTFLDLLRAGFSINEEKLRARLQVHAHQDYEALVTFWSEKLAIPPFRSQKPTVTAAGQKMKRRDYMGTCTVKYFDVALLLHITGIHEALAGRFTNSLEGAST